ncbi:MAG: hypothetical protein M3Z26_10600 [Bacteroidota bacterium]|nr:hypothetical protein [Bacteroidota bacterium]
MKLIFFSTFLFFCYSSFSQVNNDTSSNYFVQQSIQLYNQFSGAEAAIYNGREYIPYTFKKEGNAFFGSDQFTNGWISYQGHIYQAIPMQYDVVRNQVVILNFDNRSAIFLQNEAIDSFYFLEHTFIRMEKNSALNLNSTGFYDRLLNGRIQVIAARKKGIKETIPDNQILRVFENKDRFYVFKNTKFYWVNNKKEVFSLFSDKRHEIKTGMRKQKIKFSRNNFEEALMAASAIYDQSMK